EVSERHRARAIDRVGRSRHRRNDTTGRLLGKSRHRVGREIPPTPPQAQELNGGDHQQVRSIYPWGTIYPEPGTSEPGTSKPRTPNQEREPGNPEPGTR